MKLRKLIVGSIVSSSLVLSLAAQASRTGSPSDGAPFPANNYAHFDYLNGVVRHTFTGGSENWDLSTHTEQSGAKATVLRAKGNATTGVECWNFFTSTSGATTAASSSTTPSGCSGAPNEITLPTVTFSEGTGFMGVTCKLPAAQTGCDPRIAYYRYTSDPHGSTRTGAPNDGAPWPSTIYNEFSYLDGGGVQRQSTQAGLRNWDLTPHIDAFGSHHALVLAKGNSSQGATCWGVSVDSSGSGTLGTTAGSQPSCNGAPVMLDTPTVTIPTNGTFLVTCQLPPRQTGCTTPRLSYYRFDAD